MPIKSETAPETDLEISGRETLKPTPDILDALEKDYPLEASIADLVDNSIDAKAKRVLIRFIKKSDRLTGLYVVDNGRGMNASELRQAMQFGARRDYGSKELGMFGVGLKTASLSQADTLTVASRRKGGKASGRQWTREGIKRHDWSLNVLKPSSADSLLEHDWGGIGQLDSGTVVRWDNVSDFDRLRSDIDAYIERAIVGIQRHLGLKLHRFLERGQLSIYIDVEDLDINEAGPPSKIMGTTPFPKADSNGARGFPKEFLAKLPDGQTLSMTAHIWRKKSADQGYKLGGGKVAEHQGFYFYRHDRLIQDGGWSGVASTNEPHLSLARVEVDIPERLRSYLKVRSNKAGIDAPATFSDAVVSAEAHDGMTFRKFMVKAEEVYRHRGEQKGRPMLRPDAGIPAEVRAALERKSIHFLRGKGCSVTWGRVSGAGLLEIDRENRQITLNKKYRSTLLRGAHGSASDLPLLRTLLYFTFESLIAGDRIGPVERLRLEAVKTAMDAALKLEKRWAEK